MFLYLQYWALYIIVLGRVCVSGCGLIAMLTRLLHRIPIEAPLATSAAVATDSDTASQLGVFWKPELYLTWTS